MHQNDGNRRGTPLITQLTSSAPLQALSRLRRVELCMNFDLAALAQLDYYRDLCKLERRAVNPAVPLFSISSFIALELTSQRCRCVIF